MQDKSNKLTLIWMLLGIFICAFAGGYYILHGGSIAVSPHDQLDQDVLTFMLRARNMFASEYELLLNGAPAYSVQLFAPALVLSYMVFSPETAFAINYSFVMLIAFLSQFLLLKSFKVRPLISFVGALSFAFLPFYSVYGFSVMGVPLFFLAAKMLWIKDDAKSFAIALLLMAIFAAYSSPAYGYAELFILLVCFCLGAVKQRSIKGRPVRFLVAIIIMLVTYILLNWDMVMSIVHPSELSHREEFVLEGTKISIAGFISFLRGGQPHAVSNQYYISFFVFIVLAVILFKFGCAKASYKDEKSAELVKCFYLVVGLLIAIAAFYVIFHSGAVTQIRNSLSGAMKSFQFDRFYWLYPALWYFALASGCELLLRIAPDRVVKALVIASFTVVLLLTLNISAKDNLIMKTVENDLAPGGNTDTKNLTWDGFFGGTTFKQVSDDLAREGESISDLKTISLGLYPAIAMYNGFACLDGYSISYPLSYKHEFYDVIKDELSLSNQLKTYYQNWGSRCYAMSHEIGMDFFVTKDEFKILKDLRLDVDKLREMGCDYIFSAVEIANAKDLNLSLFGKYDSDDLPYNLYVYRI